MFITMILKALLTCCLFWTLFSVVVSGLCGNYLGSKYASYFVLDFNTALPIKKFFFKLLYSAYCDSHSTVTPQLDQYLMETSNKIVFLFTFLVVSLGLVKFVFKTAFTNEIVGHLVSLYFFGFIVYRVCYGLGMHPMVFLIVSFGYFLWAIFNNVKAYGQLCGTAVLNLNNCRDTLCDDLYKFNKNLARYFLIVSIPLFANLVYAVINIYVDGLFMGFMMTASTLIDGLILLDEINYFLVAFFNYLVYRTFSLAWSKSLFEHGSTIFYKLAKNLIYIPLVILAQLAFIPYANSMLNIFLFLFFMQFVTLFSALLIKRIKLSDTTTPLHRDNVLFCVNALLLFYNAAGYTLGAYTVYISMMLHEFINTLISVMLEGGYSIHVPSIMVYSNNYSFDFNHAVLSNDAMLLVGMCSLWLLFTMFFIILLGSSVLFLYTVYCQAYQPNVYNTFFDYTLCYKLFVFSVSVIVLMYPVTADQATLSCLVFLVIAPQRKAQVRLAGLPPLIIITGVGLPLLIPILANPVKAPMLTLAAGFAAQRAATTTYDTFLKTLEAFDVRNSSMLKVGLEHNGLLHSHAGPRVFNVSSAEEARILSDECKANPELARSFFCYMTGTRAAELTFDQEMSTTNHFLFGNWHLRGYLYNQTVAFNSGIAMVLSLEITLIFGLCYFGLVYQLHRRRLKQRWPRTHWFIEMNMSL